jgi:Protein of unknown function (DUF1203)
MDFRVLPLDPAPFQHLFGLDDDALAAQAVETVIVDECPGFPCRIGLRDPEPGRRMLLLNYEHQPAATPYRARHAIFIEDGARSTAPWINRIDDYLGTRLLSVRAFDTSHHMRDADVCAGRDAAALFRKMLTAPGTDYLQVHTARRGCYLARVEGL